MRNGSVSRNVVACFIMYFFWVQLFVWTMQFHAHWNLPRTTIATLINFNGKRIYITFSQHAFKIVTSMMQLFEWKRSFEERLLGAWLFNSHAKKICQKIVVLVMKAVFSSKKFKIRLKKFQSQIFRWDSIIKSESIHSTEKNLNRMRIINLGENFRT